MAPETREIAGWPAEIRRVPVGAATVELWTVAALESLLDRDQLLRDDSLEPPYWALVWTGAPLVAQWAVERLPLRGRAVLDVGCGLGLVSLALAEAGAVVTAIDREAAPVAFVAESARRTGLAVEAVVDDVRTLGRPGTFDVVIAAELLYERASFPEIADALVAALAPRGSLLVGDAFRVRTDAFYDALEAHGLRCVEERRVAVDEEGTRVWVRLAQYAR